MPHDPILHLIGLAKKAGRLEVGEEPAGAACRARRAHLLLAAADAAPNTFRRAAHFGEAGGVLWLELPFPKSELGGCVGRTSCALMAVTDAGFASAIAKKLQARDPERYQAASLRLEEQAAQVLQRQREQRQHEKNLAQGRKKPWAPPPKESPRPTRGRDASPAKENRGHGAASGERVRSSKPGAPPPDKSLGASHGGPGQRGRPAGPKPGRALAPGRKVTVRGKLPPKK